MLFHLLASALFLPTGVQHPVVETKTRLEQVFREEDDWFGISSLLLSEYGFKLRIQKPLIKSLSRVDAHGPSSFTVEFINEYLHDLTLSNKKEDMCKSIMSEMSVQEQELFLRCLAQNMRLKIGKPLLVKIMAKSIGLAPTEFVKLSKVEPLNVLVDKMMKREATSDITLHVPFQPMLASPLKKDMPKRGWCEMKYDGERLLVHYSKSGGCRAFSRSRRDVTKEYQHLCDHLAALSSNLDSFVLDGEVCAKDGSFASLRRRKIEAVELVYFVFDLLLLDGQQLGSQVKLFQRREMLESTFQETNMLQFAQRNSSESVDEFLNKSVEQGLEGIVVKQDSLYDYGKRSKDWIKIKTGKESLDCIIVGAYFGEGRRGETYGSFLMCCQDPKGNIVPVCKVGTGFSDRDLKTLTEELTVGAEQDIDLGVYKKPDVWISDGYILEIEGDSLTSGGSLRFPRFKRVRDDLDQPSVIN